MSVETDSEGRAYFKGFYGDYSAVINGTEYTISAVKSMQKYPDGTGSIMIELA